MLCININLFEFIYTLLFCIESSTQYNNENQTKVKKSKIYK